MSCHLPVRRWRWPNSWRHRTVWSVSQDRSCLWESARHGSVAVDFRRFGADMAGIATRLWMCLVGWLMLGIVLPHAGGAAGATTSPEGPPLDITAERIEYLQETETYEADGSVVVNQGTLRLTADHMTIQALPGVL